MKPLLAVRSKPVRQLREAGCRLLDLTRPFYLPGRLFCLLSFVSRPAALFLMVARLWLALLFLRPKLAILSQGGNWDGFLFARVLARLKVPYVIISQKATELYWPPDYLGEPVRRLYESALHAYFVSDHNWRLTELQIGARIHPASVARNPFLVPYEQAPSPIVHRDVVDFACVGRLYPMEKGQDLLLSVLAQEKWRKRPVAVTFYGEGIQRSLLERMVELLGLTNVRFAGHVTDIQAVWQRHPALLLGSRCEGLPLVIVEAMLAGRVVIATAAGGSAEVIEDGVTGFIAEAPTVAAIDNAMERAWRDRIQWAEIAARGAKAIRETVPADPGTAFVSDLLHRTAFLITPEPKQAQSAELQSLISTDLA